MKKFLVIGMVVLGTATLILSIVNINLDNKSSNESVVALKNQEALSQENPGDWHSGECGTQESWVESFFGDVVTQVKECDFNMSGWMCEYGSITTYYYSYSPPYSYGSFSVQYCQG
jgi:hypothetical protein